MRRLPRFPSLHVHLGLAAGLAALLITNRLPAQNSSRAADEAWQSLRAQLAPAPAQRGPGTVPPAAAAAQADRLADASSRARAFYTQFPSDARAASARKLEVLSALESVRLGRASGEAAATALANAYRRDPRALRADRFEVALAAERLPLQRTPGGLARIKSEQHVAIADSLRREFGDIAEVHALYNGLAQATDDASSNRIATRVLEMRPAPALRRVTETITSRQALIGRPLSLRLTTTEGRTLELPATTGSAGLTVLCIWTPVPPAVPRSLSTLPHKLPGAPKDIRWIYLGLGATRAQATEVEASAPFPGTHCFDDGGSRSALAQRLKVRSAPLVYVFDRRGYLTGIGRPDELSALIAAANR